MTRAQTWGRRQSRIGAAALRDRAGRASCPSARRGDGRSLFESLEQRLHLAVILWDGGPDGLGTNFNDPVNWVGDMLPGAEDDAVVPASMGAPTITLGGSITLGSLEIYRPFTQSNFTLTLNGPSEFGDAYTL